MEDLGLRLEQVVLCPSCGDRSLTVAGPIFGQHPIAEEVARELGVRHHRDHGDCPMHSLGWSSRSRSSVPWSEMTKKL